MPKFKSVSLTEFRTLNSTKCNGKQARMLLRYFRFGYPLEVPGLSLRIRHTELRLRKKGPGTTMSLQVATDPVLATFAPFLR